MPTWLYRLCFTSFSPHFASNVKSKHFFISHSFISNIDWCTIFHYCICGCQCDWLMMMYWGYTYFHPNLFSFTIRRRRAALMYTESEWLQVHIARFSILCKDCTERASELWVRALMPYNHTTCDDWYTARYFFVFVSSLYNVGNTAAALAVGGVINCTATRTLLLPSSILANMKSDSTDSRPAKEWASAPSVAFVWSTFEQFASQHTSFKWKSVSILLA